MTTVGSPWMTMYFVLPRKRPVGARVPGSSKSLMMPLISSGLNCSIHEQKTGESSDTAGKIKYKSY